MAGMTPGAAGGAIPFDRLRAVVLDMDGTLWRGREPLPGLSAWFAFLDARGIAVVLATNNSYWRPSHYVDKLAGFGIAVPAGRILTSSVATGVWLADHVPLGARAYVVGSDALREAVRGAGCVLVDGLDPAADVVVAGFDMHLTYLRLRDAARHILAGACFVGTNPDRTYPAEDGLSPGAGSILAAIEAAAGKAPIIVGKPEPHLFAAACAISGVAPDRTLAVGDRLDTDILGARRAGMWSALVTTGVDDAGAAARGPVRPDGVFDGLDALRAAWGGGGA